MLDHSTLGLRGGTGRRCGLKIRFFRESRFDSGRGHQFFSCNVCRTFCRDSFLFSENKARIAWLPLLNASYLVDFFVKRKSTRHSSLTDNGTRVWKILKRADLHPHPGPISAKSGRGGLLRIKISCDSTRTRIRVAGGGVQEIFLYGSVDHNRVVAILVEEFGIGAIESVVCNKVETPTA